ncbi:unnamed protein product [Urochloa humidicola]
MAVGKSICPPEYVVPVSYDEPLLGRYDAAPPEKKAAAAAAEEGNASFVQTCLNGLNALSVWFILSPVFLGDGALLVLPCFLWRWCSARPVNS